MYQDKYITKVSQITSLLYNDYVSFSILPTGSVLRIENALDIHKLAAGTYVVSISDEKGSTITSKVVVQK